MNRVTRAFVPLAALAFVGCGGTTDLTGKITYQGKPVVYGSVVVIDSGGAPKSGPIQPDGSYRVSGVKTGAVKLAVSSPPPPGSQPAGKGRDGRDADDKPPPEESPPAAPEVIKNWVVLPNKYADPHTSELTGEARSGQPLNLDLK